MAIFPAIDHVHMNKLIFFYNIERKGLNGLDGDVSKQPEFKQFSDAMLTSQGQVFEYFEQKVKVDNFG